MKGIYIITTCNNVNNDVNLLTGDFEELKSLTSMLLLHNSQ